MRWLVIIAIFVSISKTAVGQGKYDANWVFGINAGIDFSDSTNPIAIHPSCFINEVDACISDSLGNLLFYLNTHDLDYKPYSIVNKEGNLISNGDSINTFHFLSNGGVFIPSPGKPNEFYLFYYAVLDSFNVFSPMYSYVAIDSVLNYTVTQKNIPLFPIQIPQSDYEAGIACTKTADGTGWWLIVHGNTLCDSTYYRFLINEQGIQGPFAQVIGAPLCLPPYTFCQPQINFSSSGKYLAFPLGGLNSVDLFQFNRCTGELYNEVLIGNIDSIPEIGFMGCAFSNDETKLYITDNTNDTVLYKSILLQIKIDSAPYQTTLLYSIIDTPILFGHLQLAPDKKLYMAATDRAWDEINSDTTVFADTLYQNYFKYLWTIDSPDSPGISCHLRPFSFYLGDSSYSLVGLPNMPNYNLGPIAVFQSTISNDTFICTNIDTPTKGVFISVNPSPGVIATWQPGPDIDSLNATRQLVNPTQSTWYYVTFTDTTIHGSCNSALDSVYVAVEVCTEAIQNMAQSNQRLTIFPNPAQSTVSIEWQFQGGQDCSLAIYDLLGRQISDQKVNGMTGKDLLNISDLSNGMYVVKLYTGNEAVMSGKLAVVR